MSVAAPVIRGEEEARAFLFGEMGVSRETVKRMECFVAMVEAEMAKQNLIAPSTAPHIWARHIADSAQLLLHMKQTGGLWVDIGSGAGFPGMIVALIADFRVLLVEPRPLRADFLSRCVDALGLQGRVIVQPSKVERLEGARADVVSARAVAPLPKLLAAASHLSTPRTLWLLPKGKNADMEIGEARRGWHVDFQVRPSRTAEDSGILVGTVKGRKR